MFQMGLSVLNREKKIRLLPFVVTTIFFILQPYPQGTVFGTIFKVLPVLSLIGYVVTTKAQFPSKTKKLTVENLIPEDGYSFCILLGLLVSFVGDVFVAIPYMCLIRGILFMFVYLCYFMAIHVGARHRDSTTSSTWLFQLLYINTFLLVQSSTESYFIKGFLLVYLVPLFLLGWKAAAALEENTGDTAVLLGCFASSLAIFSDIIVILDNNGWPIPFAEFLYMLAYYCAQCGWALSTSHFS